MEIKIQVKTSLRVHLDAHLEYKEPEGSSRLFLSRLRASGDPNYISLPDLLCPHHQDGLSSTAMASLPFGAMSKGGVSSAFLSTGLALLHLHLQGLFYCVAQAWHGGDHSPKCRVSHLP